LSSWLFLEWFAALNPESSDRRILLVEEILERNQLVVPEEK
jgi:hypothetical protein